MRTILSSFIMFIIVGCVTSAAAEDKVLGEKHFKAGVSLLKSEDYEGAATALEASIEEYPTKSGLFNLANAYKLLKRYNDALSALERLNRDFGNQLDKELKRTAHGLAQEIRDLVGKLTVTVAPAGAEVFVNGKPVGTAPLAKPLLLAPGHYEITARLNGFDFQADKLRLLSGDDLVATLTGKPVAAALELPQPSRLEPQTAETSLQETASEVSPEPERRKVTPWFWVGLGATVAVGALTGVFWGLSGAPADKANAHLAAFNELTLPEQAGSIGKQIVADWQVDADEYTKLRNLGTGFAIGTGVLAVATAVILIVDRKKSKSEQPAPRVALAPGVGGVTLLF
ncbi:MAG: tetratricopeptide repeat protein [Myxococcota bacterium]|jgi:tetratricopeptide (TPR) repeat protein|nr:tetratricopeptide repeat protein [Myxococcota bacterium]